MYLQHHNAYRVCCAAITTDPQELMYIEKLVARRRILGLDVPHPDDEASEQQQLQQSSSGAAPGSKRRRAAGSGGTDDDGGPRASEPGCDGDSQQQVEDGEGPEGPAEAEAAAGQPSLDDVLDTQQQQQQQPASFQGQAAVNAVLLGAVPRLVYQQALKAEAAAAGKTSVVSSNFLKPHAASNVATAYSSSRHNDGNSNLHFRAAFLNILGRYTSPGVDKLRQEIVDNIQQDFPTVGTFVLEGVRVSGCASFTAKNNDL